MNSRLLFYISICFILITSCSKKSALGGGPKDENHPKLLYQFPENETINVFKDTKKQDIILKFDKDVTINDPKQIVVMPSLSTDDGDNPLKIKEDGKTITCSIIPKLNPNTTYIFDFGKAIVDTHEGLTPEQLKVTFCTGESIDKNSLSGTVFDIFTRLSPKTTVIKLFKKEKVESLLKNKNKKEVSKKNTKNNKNKNDKKNEASITTTDLLNNPDFDYFVRSDEQGNYNIDNIATGKYYVCAFEANENETLCDIEKNRYGFLGPIEIKNSVQQSIPIVLANDKKFAIISNNPSNNAFEIKFSKPIRDNYKIENLCKSRRFENIHLYSNLSDDKTKLFIYKNNLKILFEEHKLKLKVTAQDQIGNTITKIVYAYFRKIKPEKHVLKCEIKTRKNPVFIDEVKATICFNMPIIRYDTKKIKILVNKKYIVDLDDSDLKLNEYRNELYLTKKINLKKLFSSQGFDMNAYTSTDFINIDILCKKEAFTDVNDNINNEIQQTAPVSLKKGTLSIAVNTSKNFQLEILNDKLEQVYNFINEHNISINDIAPGKYIIRTLILNKDLNFFDLKTKIDTIKLAKSVHFYDKIVEVIPEWTNSDIVINL